MNWRLKKSLDIEFELHEDDFWVTVTEPESGEKKNYYFDFKNKNSFNINVFNTTIGTELWSWISLWKDELKGE